MTSSIRITSYNVCYTKLLRYLYVRSGLGDKSPDNLVIVPLIFEESVLGALELAGFNKYSDFKVAYLEQIAIRITSSVSVLLKSYNFV